MKECGDDEAQLSVSVVIPVYNVERYVDECLQSVFDQTYKNLQLLLVDDCGSDHSMAVVKECVARNQFHQIGEGEDYTSASGVTLKILHHEHNRGLSAARNTGIDAATGDYVYLLDSDDTITPTCIALLVEQVSLHPGVDMVQGAIWSNDRSMNDYLHSLSRGWHVRSYTEGRRACRRLLQYGLLGPMAVNRLLNICILRKYKLYFKEGITHEDELWTFMAGKYLKSIALHIGDTYFYRKNDSGISAQFDSEKSFADMCLISDEMFERLPFFCDYMIEIRSALRMMALAERFGSRNPLQRMRYGSDVFVRAMYRHWNDARWKKAAIVLPCAVGFWFSRFFVRK